MSLMSPQREAPVLRPFTGPNTSPPLQHVQQAVPTAQLPAAMQQTMPVAPLPPAMQQAVPAGQMQAVSHDSSQHEKENFSAKLTQMVS